MPIAVSDLITEVRDITERTNDPTLSDSVISRFLSDGLRSLYDIFLESAPHWVQSKYEFALTDNTFDGATTPLPDDFQIDLGLDWLDAPGANGPVTVKRLPTFLDRNLMQSFSPLAPGFPFMNRNYECQDAFLRLYPYQQCSGSYRLWYQRRCDELQLPTTVDYTILPADIAVDVGGNIQYNLTGLTLSDGMIGGSLTVTFASPNTAWNCTAKEVVGPLPFDPTGHALLTGQAWPGGSFTSPPTGTASITYQPAGTVNTLPALFVPWKIYIVTYAAISVRMRFEESTQELQVRLQQEERRARLMSEKRDSDLRQIPILNGGRFVDSPYYDSGSAFGWGTDGGWGW